MKHKKHLFLVLFFTLFGVFAQEKKYSLSLDEAIKFALENSYTSRNANKEVAKAIQQKWETIAVGLPQINGELNYSDQFKQRLAVVPANTFVPSAPPDLLTAIALGVTQQVDLSATLTQLIFDGSYLVGLEAASVFVDYTNNQKEKQDLMVIEGITNSYGSVLLTQESIAVLERNITTLENNYNEISKIFKNGLAEEESVEQLQITLLQVKNQLNNTKRLEQIALQMLKLSLGMDLDNQLELTSSLKGITSNDLESNITLKDFDIQLNNDFKASELLVEQRRLEHKLEKARILPSLGAFLNLGTLTGANEFVFLDTDTKWYPFSTFGASLKVPIFSSFRSKARIKMAKLAWEQAEVSHSENTQKIQLAHEQAKSNFEFAIDNLNTLKQNLDLAERIEKKNQIKFNEGISSSFDLRQAQTQLYSAQQEYLQAQLKVIQDKAKLQSILNVFNLK